MEKNFKGFTVEYIDRNKNTEADELAKAGDRNTHLSIKTIEPEPRVINIIQGENWRAPIRAYLRHYYELDTTVEKIRMQQRAQTYQLVDNGLLQDFSIRSPPSLR
jgi:hypothetical protein